MEGLLTFGDGQWNALLPTKLTEASIRQVPLHNPKTNEWDPRAPLADMLGELLEMPLHDVLRVWIEDDLHAQNE
ncbi:unnamed protein product [Linum trigynum]|uniref:Uncharacterized protein n=1 Tax=Linum trigynum TaxID=586398 RepID=A0AAV2DKR7_9ROSI